MLYLLVIMITPIKKHWQELLALSFLFLAFIFAHRFFFLPGDFPTHDGVHFIRLYDLEKVLRQGQFPPRWLPSLGKGYGYPFFNFYPPLSYFAGLLFRFFGASFTLANKLSFALAGFLGAVGMFLLAKKFFANFWSGAIAVLFWLLLPYRALDLYVRGSLAEYWGLNLLPLVFYWAESFFTLPNRKQGLVLALGLFFLLIAHNGVALIGVVWLAVFLLFLLTVNREWSWLKLKKWLILMGPFLLAAGMAAFFIVPAIWEKGFTQIADMTSDYYAYYNHFPSLGQLFISRFWGYGGSNFGLNDEMSFQIGHFHSLAALTALFLLVGKLILKRGRVFRERKLGLALFFLISFLGFAFLSHQRSSFLWEKLPFLVFLQFPWRLLIFIGFSASVLAGFGLTRIKKGKTWLFFLSGLVLLVLGFSYFQPREMVDIDDNKYLSSPLWEYQQREFLTDYLPKTVEVIPKDYYRPPLILASGETRMILDQADKIIFTFLGEADQKVTIKRFYFPGWQAKIDGKLAEIDTSQNGFMVLALPEGQSRVELFFGQTTTRRLANRISLAAWMLFFWLAFSLRKKTKRTNPGAND